MFPEKIIQEIKENHTPSNNKEKLLIKTLANATKRLAGELYSKDTHFIFELIQNAEDNAYATGKKPSLCFKLRSNPSEIIVENNEQGFFEKHVRSICDVADSTKEKTEGYIGEKGIGFKSVFRVTDCPSIHSNGYHFSLPEKHPSGLGYITPEWIENPPKEINPDITTIVIPINKPDWTQEKIALALREIKPETILFLKKLQSIEVNIDIKDSDALKIIIKKDVSRYPLVKLTHIKKVGDAEEERQEILYWCAEKEFEKPPTINPEEREDINKRSVSIAIPLSKGHKGKLFSYLPVYEDTGMPFLINSDFLLVSSREGVKTDEPWNQWLRGCIAEVYTKAVLSCLATDTLPIEERIMVYASIPRNTKIPFLNCIIAEIKDTLKKERCILSASEDLLTPDTIKRASSDFRELFMEEDTLPQHLKSGVQFVHKQLENFSEQMNFLGVAQFQIQDVSACLKDTGWLSDRQKPWFIKLYSYLMDKRFQSQSWHSCSIFPVLRMGETTERLSSVSEQPIYFYGEQSLKNVPDHIKNLVPIAFLESNLQKLIDEQTEIKRWLHGTLNVREFTFENYQKDVLQKIKNEDTYNKLSEDGFLQVTEFILEQQQTEDIPVLLDDGKRVLLKKPNRGSNFSYPPPTIVVPPEDFSSKDGWQHIWGGNRTGFYILSNKYRKDVVEKMLGQRFILNFPFEANKESLRLPTICAENGIVSAETSKALLRWLKETARVSSSVANSLKEISWLPVKKGGKEVFCEPPKVFLSKSSIKEILGNEIPYFPEGVLPDQVVADLEIKTDIDYETLLSTLESYSGDAEISSKTMERIYSELAHRTQNGNRGIRQFFQEKELIFSSKDKRWHDLDKCIWKDCSETLGNDFLYLEKLYPHLKDFFVETLGVKEDADPEAYAKRWLILQSDRNSKRDALEKALTDIYRVLLPVAEREEKPDWWSSLKTKAMIYTEKGTFVSSKNVFFPDDGEYQKIFDYENVNYAWKPKEFSSTKCKSFYAAFGIPPLSESVEEHLERRSEGGSQEPRYLTKDAVLMIASWIREKEEVKYDVLFERGILKSIIFTGN